MLEKSFSSFGYFKSMEISGDYIYMLSQNSVYGLYNNGSFSLPYYIEENVNNINYENIQYFPETGDDDYTLLSAVSISEPSKAANVKAFMGAGKNICLSNSNFYVAKNRNTAFGNYDNIENTYVYRFSINNGEINLSGTTNILGHLIDRYAISESNGYCMLVTQFTDKPSSNTACNVSVLNNNMEICGQANEIARGTEISSVVFTQDQVMLMPVERGGSIYSVDIQNPTKPIGKGALKLSTGNALVYNYDENHILYLDNGNDILKVTMADITNFDAPKILHRQELGSYPHISTTLLNNKNSFFFDSEKNAMYVPVVIYGEDDEVVFEGTYIYNVFTDEGINRIGEVSAEKYDKVYKFRGKVLLLSDKEAVITDVNDLSTIKIIEFW